MGLKKLVFLIVLGTFATCNGFNHLLPWDKEVVYDWKALVKAGTHFPASYASQFILHGKLHVQANNNATHVQISDLTYKLYNGLLDHVHEHESHDVPAPPEVQDMHHPFKIVYDGHGAVIGISTHSHEKEFSRNIKKAIASILQVNHTVIEHSHHLPHAFVTKEHSLYGWGDVDYNVLPHGDVIEIHKSHDMHRSTHLYQYFVTNTAPMECDSVFDEPIMHDSHRKYLIIKQDGHHIVKHIVATGGVYYYPHKGKSDSHYILVNQTFDMMLVSPISQKLHVQDEHFENHLTYHAFDEHHQGESVLDLSNGRHVVHHDKLITQVQAMFDDVWKYLQEDHLHTHTPDTKRGQLINRLRRLLTFFDLHHLEELHLTLSHKSDKHHVEVFYHILPLVGTKASVLLAKKLIVNKVVSDDVATKILQHLPDNIIEPTEALLHELEQFIHLDENIHWDVRKTAIITFGSLIHKSWIFLNKIHNIHKLEGHHMNQQDEGHQDHRFDAQKVYEHYIMEYVNKVRGAHDYKVLTVWLQGLYNMKMHSTIHHLEPAIRGEWWHEPHWRSLALWAVYPSIHGQDSNHIVELFWPIFTNHNENTEIRILAYFLIMETHPSHSRLTNIYWHLMNEPNEEVYNFHYTYVHSHLSTTEPCHHQFRVHLAHIFKYMQPPSHGTSSAYLHDFTDVNFGFSGGLSSMLINSNTSQWLVAKKSFQVANVFHEDYKIIIRMHGFKKQLLAPLTTHYLHYSLQHLAELFTQTHTTNPSTDDIFVEAIVIRHQHVVYSLYYDKHNLHEINLLADFLVKDQQSFNSHLLDITYDRYHKVLIPTDLGFPATWEYLVPSVHKFDFSVTKEVSNKIVKVHVDNKYVNWIHYRHGLSFYNPIVDVWQGVNRYHAYDSALPIHLDITLNTQQQSLQLSWKKHNDVHLDVAGFRTHVKQMVFIKDDYQSNVLLHSSPHSKEWVVVTHGDQYRNDYSLLHHDDLNTGHKWRAVVYDSEYHISNGTFNHLMSIFTEPYHKNFDNVFGDLLTSWGHFHHYVTYLPDPGMYGLLVRIEPSHQYSVSNIDLSIRLNQEEVSDDYVFAHGSKTNTRLTYSVKNKEQSLKTWDINTILDLNPGHTVNNLKMHLTRIIPGQKDYKVCIEGVKKWGHKEISGHLNIAMSQTPDGKCVKDDTVVDITMTGQRSHEQEHEHHIYGSCHYTIPYSVQPYHTMQCLTSHTTVRHNTYNVKTANVPSEFKKWFNHKWDQIKGYYISFYDFVEEHNVNIGDHTFKVDVVYPMQGEEVDVHITTPHHIHKLTGIPNHRWEAWSSPDSMVYSQKFLYSHNVGQVDHCVVHHDHWHFNHHLVSKKVPNDWTVYVGDAVSKPQRAVFIKHVSENKIAIRVMDHSHVFEIVPHGDTHQISLDGQVISEHLRHEDWMAYHVFSHEGNHPVAAMFPHLGVHIEYDVNHIVVITPKLENHWHGHCYQV